MDLLEESDHTTHCPFKGDASYWSVKVMDKVAENAVWSYPEPVESAPPVAGYQAFYWRTMHGGTKKVSKFSYILVTPTTGSMSWIATAT
jgi:uncharacterized protein (DUF427 family)